MSLGGKGFSVSLVVLLVVVVAAVAFVIGGNYKIPTPYTGQLPAPSVSQEAAVAENATLAQSTNVDVQVAQNTVASAGQSSNEGTNPVASVAASQPAITTNHVVISEIKIAGSEFVELYNPTSSDVDMNGWWIGYYPPFSEWGTPKVYTPLKLGSTIKSHGFFLIGGRGYTNGADAQLSSTPDQGVLGDFGGVAIFKVDIRGMGSEDVKSKKVDVVGWGVSDYAVEGKPVKFDEYTDQALSLERKPGQLEPSNGNYVDTENNVDDFLVRDSPDPQSSSSSIEP